MKPITAVGITTLLLSLSGCATTGNSKAYARCTGLPAKQDCEIGGEISGSWGGSKDLGPLAGQLLAAAEVIDAAQFTLDVGGSTISYPSTGTATLILKNASGTVIATRDFGWRRAGTVVRLADPDAVNTWALARSGVQTLDYKLKPFPLIAGYGEQRIVVRSLYEGVETASSSSSFYRCTIYPSPYSCAQ
jgi:hypothetical protein